MSARASTLVGRDEEFERITEILDAAERLPSTIVVHGEAGMGKTALWLAALDYALGRDYRLLTSRPSEAETRFSYAGLDDLLGAASEGVLRELPPIQRRALESALLLGDSELPANERAVATAFLGALRLLSRDGRLLVAVDDVQWLDPASVAVLGYALARLDREPLGVLLTVRGDTPDWLRRGVPEERLRAIGIDGLSLGAFREVLRARLGAAFPRPTLLRLWETANGNPFFGLELAEALERRGGALAPGEELPIPSSLDELLQSRIAMLGGAALSVARAVAAVAEPSVALVEAAVGSRADGGLAECFAARAVELDGERLRFTHPLLRSAVTAGQTPAQRRSLHARLAELVPSSEEKARHLALASPEPSAEVATTLEAASREAHLRGAPATSAELVERALRLTPSDAAADAHRRLIAAAQRHHEAGDSARAIDLLTRALHETPSGDSRAIVLQHLAGIRFDALGAQGALETYDAALAEARGDPTVEAEIRLDLAMAVRGIQGVDWALEHAEAALEAALLASDGRLESKALAVLGVLSFNAGRGIDRPRMERALELERLLPEPRHALATMAAYHQLDWAVELDAARELAVALLAELRARNDPAQGDALFHLALIELRAGNWDAATRYSEEEHELLLQAGHEGFLHTALFPRAAIAAHRGQLAEARGYSESALADAAEQGAVVTEAGHAWVLGFAELSEGNASAALPQLRRSAASRDSMGLREPGMRFDVGDLLEALIATGELDEAAELLATWEPRAAALDRAWSLAVLARCGALLLAARGDLPGAFAAFDRALAEHARTNDPFQHTRTLLALGRTQRRAKRRALARSTLEDALARFDALGAPLWAEQTRAELARIGGRAPSRGELTEAERRIALLVADGRRNREVAAELYLTEHSVETALSRIYRKLGIRSRGELGRAMSNS